METLKGLLAALSILIGFFMIIITGAASHGQFKFNPAVLEDWLWYGTILLMFSIPIGWLVKRLKERKRIKQV